MHVTETSAEGLKRECAPPGTGNQRSRSVYDISSRTHAALTSEVVQQADLEFKVDRQLFGLILKINVDHAVPRQ